MNNSNSKHRKELHFAYKKTTFPISMKPLTSLMSTISVVPLKSLSVPFLLSWDGFFPPPGMCFFS